VTAHPRTALVCALAVLAAGRPSGALAGDDLTPNALLESGVGGGGAAGLAAQVASSSSSDGRRASRNLLGSAAAGIGLGPDMFIMPIVGGIVSASETVSSFSL
jgi:hypothetical protein